MATLVELSTPPAVFLLGGAMVAGYDHLPTLAGAPAGPALAYAFVGTTAALAVAPRYIRSQALFRAVPDAATRLDILRARIAAEIRHARPATRVLWLRFGDRRMADRLWAAKRPLQAQDIRITEGQDAIAMPSTAVEAVQAHLDAACAGITARTKALWVQWVRVQPGWTDTGLAALSSPQGPALVPQAPRADRVISSAPSFKESPYAHIA